MFNTLWITSRWAILSLFLGIVAIYTFIPDFYWNNELFHVLIEGGGSVIGFGLAAIVLAMIKKQQLSVNYIWLIACFISMGTLDMFHSQIHPGQVFVWLHSVATFIGGLFAMLIWLPESLSKKFFKLYYLWLILLISIVFSIFSILIPDLILTMLDANKQFTSSAGALNIIGGFGFLIAWFYFVKEYHRHHHTQLSFFSNHFALFGIAGLLFEISILWDASWWFWHTMRAFAYLLLIFHFRSIYIKSLKRAEKSLIDSERQLHTLVQSLPDLVWLKDAEGAYLICNPKFERFFGHKEAEIVGKTDYDFVDKDLADFFREHDKQAMVAGKPTMNEEEVTYADDAHKELLETVKTPMYNTDGTLIGVLGVGRDITERRQTEAQLRRTQKMDALGKLTGGIAHDYNNMLGVILGYSELIEEIAREQPELTDYINQIKHAGERGTKLTKKLLTFSRNESSENKIVNLNTLLEGSQLMLEKTLTVRISLVYELEKNCWPINLDESDLEDAILNMSINAMHSIEGTGQLTFETRNEAIKEIDAQHLDIPAGDYVLLNITDTGCGMDNKTKENIFDPFFSTKGELGTGLGLSQVYGFAQRSKGNVIIYSEPGHGSRFTLYFPRYHESDIEEKQLKEAEETNLSGNQVILVVDDEHALAELTSHILTQQGYRVFTAHNGEDALSILEKEAVDVLVSDVIMPEMDGYELASIVQEKYPNIKIQLASGFNDDRHTDNVSASLHENLLHKPYHSKKLLLRIRELLNGSAD